MRRNILIAVLAFMSLACLSHVSVAQGQEKDRPSYPKTRGIIRPVEPLDLLEGTLLNVIVTADKRLRLLDNTTKDFQ